MKKVLILLFLLVSSLVSYCQIETEILDVKLGQSTKKEVHKTLSKKDFVKKETNGDKGVAYLFSPEKQLFGGAWTCVYCYFEKDVLTGLSFSFLKSSLPYSIDTEAIYRLTKVYLMDKYKEYYKPSEEENKKIEFKYFNKDDHSSSFILLELTATSVELIFIKK